MKIKVATRGEVTILQIEGAIKSGDEYQLAERMEQYIKPDTAPKFIVDMKKVPFINSQALGLFLNIYKHIDYLKGRIVFSGLNSDIENLMNLTQLSMIFEIYKAIDEAIDSFED
ncbi:MAG: STAS domain-containing protein [Leptonema illini]|jgi:anti-anti-sigma factor|uniref:Anti-sigma factor antagonist n=2 Tax=Leptonema illini TaxID=183 RepID=H2CII2_9LEPT|nr:STAS domain-containing protein [Leptonema illini]EHQ05975.1 anti-anti-sigma factor [Leptonema illini DSM 21528]KAB2931368.1 MAG: STAS domain-containing protein [Leptonema illini]PKL30570.1 MAG: anti-sigma factor antagonist [Spirochaetae bacterium HGW-Spirochaetae-10]